MGNDNPFIRHFINRLHAKFTIKYMGALNYFLGLEVSYTTTDLFLNQSKYAHDMLTHVNVLDLKPVGTPLSINVIFVSSGTPNHDPTHYYSLVGAL